jgi:hypothetical protein
MPIPTRKSAAIETEKIRFRKSERGSTGSGARRSTDPKRRSPRSAAPKRPRMPAEVHGCCGPPRISPRRRQVRETVSRSAPT